MAESHTSPPGLLVICAEDLSANLHRHHRAKQVAFIEEGYLMVVDLLRWPPKARQFQEVIAAAVESFSREGRSYNYARSACEQLRERILELRLPEQMQATCHGKQ
jgi:hypothetical protein